MSSPAENFLAALALALHDTARHNLEVSSRATHVATATAYLVAGIVEENLATAITVALGVLRE